MADVEESSLFGTAVHAVLRSAARRPVDDRRPPGVAAAATWTSVDTVEPSLEDVFLDVVEKAARDMKKALAVGKKEFRQIVRDRRTLMILLFIPVFFLLLYGYALNFDIKHVALAVEDRDNSVESRALVSAFLNSGLLRPRGHHPVAARPASG